MKNIILTEQTLDINALIAENRDLQKRLNSSTVVGVVALALSGMSLYFLGKAYEELEKQSKENNKKHNKEDV